MVLLFFIITNFYKVDALSKNLNLDISEKSLNEILEKDEIFLKYDVRTNTTIEVNMKDVWDTLKTKNNSDETKNYFESFTQYKPDKSFKQSFKLLSNPYATLIEDTSIFPYKCVCKATYKDFNGEALSGSAYLVGANIALTAAHCFMDPDNNNERYLDWKISPGFSEYYHGSVPTNIYTGYDEVYWPKAWNTSHDAGNDYAICVLNDDIGLTVGGWLGGQSYGVNEEMENLEVISRGYPANTNLGFTGNFQYESSGSITGVSDSTFDFSTIVCTGFSGGPVTRNSDGYVIRNNKQSFDELV